MLIYFTEVKEGMDKKVLEKIKKAKVKVKGPKETYKIRPLQIVPFMRVKETRIGTAKIDSKKTPYIKVKGETTIKDLVNPLVIGEDIIEMGEKIFGKKRKSNKGVIKMEQGKV